MTGIEIIQGLEADGFLTIVASGTDEVSCDTCGHLASQHGAKAECLVDDCECALFEGDVLDAEVMSL